jgi:hypothetical protein
LIVSTSGRPRLGPSRWRTFTAAVTASCLRSDRLAPKRTCGGYGAVYGAFKSRRALAAGHATAISTRAERGRKARTGGPKPLRQLRAGSHEALARARAASAPQAANPAATTPAASRTPSGDLARASDTARERSRNAGRRWVRSAGATRRRGCRGASTTPNASSGHGWQRIGNRSQDAPPPGERLRLCDVGPRGDTSVRWPPWPWHLVPRRPVGCHRGAPPKGDHLSARVEGLRRRATRRQDG